MKQFSSQFKKQSESIRMRAPERRELREKLVSYMEYHPLPKEMRASAAVSKGVAGGIISEPFFAFNFNTTYLRNFSGIFAVLCIFAVPVIAEKSLPGDVLYPVKVQFTEEVRSSLTLTPFAKVAWETQRLERRISEARLLASEGKLTAEVQTQFAEAIKTHADAAQRELAVLKESDADKAVIAQIAFASALEVQSEVLEGHGSDGLPASEQDATAILAVANVVQEARSSVEIAQGSAPVSYENVLAAVESESTQVYELFSSVRSDASGEEVADIERRLEDVKRKIADARALHDGTPASIDAEVASVALLMSDVPEAGIVSDEIVLASKIAVGSSSTEVVQDTTLMTTTLATDVPIPEVQSVDPEVAKSEATAILKDALTDIQKLINYLTNIEVRESVSIEKLVPVTPTAGERAHEIKGLYDVTKTTLIEIDKRELGSKLRNKVRYGKEETEERLQETINAMSLGNLDRAKRTVDEAHVLSLDLQKLVAEEPLKEVVEGVALTVDSESEVETETETELPQ